MSPTIGTLAGEAAAALRAAGIEEARLQADLLLADVLCISRTALRLDPGREVDEAAQSRYRGLLERRLRREPLQYILGEVHFRELRLRVDQRVLIPRPETEVLAGAVLDWAGARGRGGAVADIGTGSGAIALSLAAEGAFDRVVATDVSAAALEVARDNAVALGLAGRVSFREGSLYGAFEKGERFDAIVSNPPYVAESEAGALAAEVRDWEPAGALFADAAGFGVLFALTDGGAGRLVPGGVLALEVGLGQADAVARRMLKHGFCNVRVLPDLAGVERIVLGERAPDGGPAEGAR